MTTPGRFERPGKAPLGVFGMLLVVAVVELSLAARSNSFTDLMATTWKYSASKARKDAPRSRILCFGSSLVKFGVLPKVIETETGEPSYNLAVYGGRMASNYILLKKSLEAGAHPKAILIDCHDGPIPFEKRNQPIEAFETNHRNWPELLSLRDSLELSIEAGDSRFFASMLVSQCLPSVRCRPEIRSTIMKGLGGEPIFVDPNIFAALRNWNTNRGTQVMTRAPHGPDEPAPAAEELAAEGHEALKAGKNAGNPFSEDCFSKLLALAASHKIQVFLLMAPLTPAIQASRDAGGHSLFDNQLAKRAMERNSNLVVLDARWSGYGLAAFHDLTHLNNEGALTISHDIGGAIAAHLSERDKARWVNLPRYRKLPNQDNVETFEQSRVAVGMFNNTRR